MPRLLAWIAAVVLWPSLSRAAVLRPLEASGEPLADGATAEGRRAGEAGPEPVGFSKSHARALIRHTALASFGPAPLSDIGFLQSSYQPQVGEPSVGAPKCGGVACGGVACGGVACGGVACGGVACGGVACGGVACGGRVFSSDQLTYISLRNFFRVFEVLYNDPAEFFKNFRT
jgi:hypothetical protein